MSANKSKDRPIADYNSVASRIELFYEKFPMGRIITEMIEHDRESGFVIMRAEVYRSLEEQFPSSTGYAYEMRGEGYVNRTSYIENAETSAIGRALANLDFKTKGGPRASTEEMNKVRRLESVSPRTDKPADAKPDKIDSTAFWKFQRDHKIAQADAKRIIEQHTDEKGGINFDTAYTELIKLAG